MCGTERTDTGRGGVVGAGMDVEEDGVEGLGGGVAVLTRAAEFDVLGDWRHGAI